jgi:hypothetical protein
MKTLLAIAALAAVGFASNGANADSVHRHHRGGAEFMRHTSAATPDPTSFQSLYQRGDLSRDCQERIFGFCPVR